MSKNAGETKPVLRRPRVRGTWLLFAGVTILVAVAAGAIALWRQNSAKAAPKQQVTTSAPAPFNGPEISLTGKIQAQKVVNVASPIDGAVESFAAEVGDDVYEGQLIARIKNVKIDLAAEGAGTELEQAQSRVQESEGAIIAARLEASRARADASRSRSEFDRADKAFQRQRLLFREGATPRLTFEKAETEYNSLKEESTAKDAVARQIEERVSSLNRDLDTFKRMLAQKTETAEDAKADLAAGDVHAPADGVVIARRGQPGEEVTRQMVDLFRIATALSAMEIVVEPPPPALLRIKAGQAAVIRVAEMPDEPINGTVREVVGTSVIIDFTSPTPLIKPGLSAQVIIKLT